MMTINLYTLIAFFLFFVAGTIIPAHTKYKFIANQKFSQDYLKFQQASKNRKRLILILLVSGVFLLCKYPLEIGVQKINPEFHDFYLGGINVSSVFFALLIGAELGNFLLKYFGDKK